MLALRAQLVVYGAACLFGVGALVSPGFVVRTPDGASYVGAYAGRAITELTYAPPLQSLGRFHMHLVYAFTLLTAGSITDTGGTQKNILALTVVAIGLFVLAWARTASANQQSIDGVATVHLPATYLFGVLGIVFYPACLAMTLHAARKKKTL